MVLRDPCFFTLVICAAFVAVFVDARSWDIAVAIGPQIDFFKRNGEQIENTGQSAVVNAVSLTGLAYDTTRRTMYMSDRKNNNVSLARSSLAEGNLDPHPMLRNMDGRRISAMVFDPVTDTLFWIDCQAEAVMKTENPLNGAYSDPIMIHDLKGLSPHSIALAICHRFIYWANSDKAVHSIERSRLDGTERRKILSNGLHEVFALAVDHSGEKLYFANVKYNQYTIERSNLDGTNRKVLVDDTHHLPVYLAVDNEAVYWTDRMSESLWKVNKDGSDKSEVKSYVQTHYFDHVMSVITRDNVGDIDCEDEVPMAKSFSNLTASMKDITWLDSKGKFE